jgi:outer membrane protein assembly factor BamD
MKQTILKLLLIAVASYGFMGCAPKNEVKEYNKPAIYWYNKMIKQISNYDLDGADDTFTSLESEHRNSPFIPGAMMIIATAHMDEEEYAMANYYLDEYLKRFSLKRDADYIRYLKIKSNFLAFESQYREQNLLDETVLKTDEFLEKYPNSEYVHLVQTMQARLLMARAMFDKEISELYGRLDKEEAKKFYENKASRNWKNIEDIKEVNVPWYRAVFE